jgi:hypothetical protein
MSSPDVMNPEGGASQDAKREQLRSVFETLVASGIVHPDNKEAHSFFQRALAGEFVAAEKEKTFDELVSDLDAAEYGTPAHNAAKKALENKGFSVSINPGDRYDLWREGEHYINTQSLFDVNKSGLFGRVRKHMITGRDGETVRKGEADIYV